MTGGPELDTAAAVASIQALVAKYDAVLKSGKKRQYHEPRTVNEFIQPLFLALGWDVHNALGEDDVLPEDAVSRGRVDWAFRIGGVPRFFLEAKNVNENLEDPKWARQAINYAYNKSVTWAVLTNFERLRIYNAEWIGANPNQNLFIELSYTEYVDQFDRLALLSRAGMAARSLDELADAVHKKLKKTPVGERLFGDLLTFRSMLRDYLRAYNPGVDAATIEHAVQRLLDRLIFIRTIEDRNIEPNQLRSVLRDLEARGKKGALWHQLLKVFQAFDTGYDSQLFAKQPLDDLDTEVEPIRVTIEGLYGARDGSIEYDFSAIDADVLGGVYEQYLGQLAKAPPVAKAKLSVADALARITKADTKPFRKAHGVYYTPRWVTRYIVSETIGRLLAEWTPAAARSLRVLDPACGSGSFLIEAFRVLDAYWAKQEPTTDEDEIRARRTRILRENLFGIDLDPQAVEIAQLNLLLVATDRRERLPDLTKNIVVANALFEDGRVPSAIAGNAPAVRWTNLGHAGKFDAIIGNPPYIRAEAMDRAERDYFMTGAGFHPVGRFDIYVLFLELGLQRLAVGGRMGMIVPAAVGTQNYGEWLRRELLDNWRIESLVDLRDIDVFHGVAVHPMIVVASDGEAATQLQILRPANDSEVGDPASWETWTLPAQLFRDMPKAAFRLGFRLALTGPIAAFERFGVRLGDICYCITGFVAHDSVTGASKDRLLTNDPSATNAKNYLEAKEVDQGFAVLKPSRFVMYEPGQMHRPKFPQLFDRPKLLVHRVTGTTGRLRATVDRAGIYVNHSFDCVVRFCDLKDAPTYARGSTQAAEASKGVSLDALAALLNSTHMSGYFRIKHGTDMDATPASLRALPLPPLAALSDGSRLAALGAEAVGTTGEDREQIMRDINDAVLAAYEITPGEQR
jgi:type I restriction-modification system DNA methylase subunit